MSITPPDYPSSPPPVKRARSKKRWIFLILFLLLVLGCYAYSRNGSMFTAGKSEREGKGNRPIPVTVETAYQRDVPIRLQVIGNIQSVSSVTLKPQVNGQIAVLHFKEGQYVQKGQLLFTIDPRPFIAALQQAEANVSRDNALVQEAREALKRDQTMVAQAQANLKRDTAQLQYAKEEEGRYLTLLNQQFVTPEQYGQMQTNARSLTGTAQADQAAIRTAQATVNTDAAAILSAQETMLGDEAVVKTNQLNLQYCYIRAPFTGRTSSYLVHVGDAVQSNTTTLVTLSQIDPTYVSFAVPQEQLSAIKPAGRRRQSGGLGHAG